MSNETIRSQVTGALVRLAIEKPLSSISITEICAEAGVSRMAFYRNYKTKEDVLRTRLEELVAHYENKMSSQASNGALWSSLEHTSMCFVYLKENSDFVRCLFRSGYTSMLVGGIASYMLKQWDNGTAEREYLLTGYAGLLVSAFGLWSARGFQESPEELAEMVRRPIPEAANKR